MRVSLLVWVKTSITWRNVLILPFSIILAKGAGKNKFEAIANTIAGVEHVLKPAAGVEDGVEMVEEDNEDETAEEADEEWFIYGLLSQLIVSD